MSWTGYEMDIRNIYKIWDILFVSSIIAGSTIGILVFR